MIFIGTFSVYIHFYRYIQSLYNANYSKGIIINALYSNIEEFISINKIVEDEVIQIVFDYNFTYMPIEYIKNAPNNTIFILLNNKHINKDFYNAIKNIDEIKNVNIISDFTVNNKKFPQETITNFFDSTSGKYEMIRNLILECNYNKALIFSAYKKTFGTEGFIYMLYKTIDILLYGMMLKNLITSYTYPNFVVRCHYPKVHPYVIFKLISKYINKESLLQLFIDVLQ